MRDGWVTQSNREAGDGRPDILTYSDWGKQAVIFEFKYVKDYEDMERAAAAALKQIAEKAYDQFFEVKTAKEVLHVGIAFCKKYCRVLMEKQILTRDVK